MIEELFSKLFFIKYEPMLRYIINCREKFLLKKILALFFAKTVLYPPLVYQKVRKAGKVWNVWDSREHDCKKIQKVDKWQLILK